MGVPKFFRYMSERYPCLSELVKDYKVLMRFPKTCYKFLILTFYLS
jgi:5'-3' exonuclease